LKKQQVAQLFSNKHSGESTGGTVGPPPPKLAGK